MADERYCLPCLPVWEEGIYQIEITDPALGYDPQTGKDGVANIQALQLGNRTLWLKARLEAAHAPDGSHALRDADFSDATAIPESRLSLDAPTGRLLEAANANDAAMDALRGQAGNKDDADLSLAGALRTLIPLSLAYAATPYAYELFTDSLSLREAARTTLLKAIAGDDSIDVMDAGGFEPGGWHVLCDEDGGRPELVRIMAVLTRRRIRCAAALAVTRRSGRLEGCSLEPGVGCGRASHAWLYVSRMTDIFRESTSGRLVVRRDPIAPGTDAPLAFWMPENAVAWNPLPLLGTEQAEASCVEDVFAAPGGVGRLLLRYPAGTESCRVYSLVLMPDAVMVSPMDRIDCIRRPDVAQARYAEGKLEVRATPYASLYAIPCFGLDIETTLDGRAEILRVPTLTGAVSLRLDRMPASLRLRWTDRENSVSAWSDAVTPEVG